MSNRLSEIEDRLRSLDNAIADLSRRVSAMERSNEAAPRATYAATLLQSDVQTTRTYVAHVLPLVGRTSIVLAGAFLLRALAESGRVPGRTGAVLGLIYATFWLGVADRQPGAPAPLSRLFHGLAAVMIGLPLLAEATVRFQFFPATTAAVTLGALSAIALGVAWHRQLALLSVVVVVGVALAMPALAIATDNTRAFAWLSIGVVAATWVLGDIRGWRALAWIAGASELLLMGLLLARALGTPALEPATSTIGILAALLVVSTVPFVVRSLRDRGSRRIFDVAHAALAAPIALTGLLLVARQVSAITTGAVGATLVAAGLGLYWISFAHSVPTDRADRNVYAATSLALGYVIVGASHVLPASALAIVLLLVGFGAVWMSQARTSGLLAVHAAVFFIVASVSSTLLGSALAGWLGAGPAWPSLTVVALVTLVGVVAGAIYGSARPLDEPRWLGIAARLFTDALAVVVLGGAIVIWAGPTFAGEPPAPAVLATVRTGVLSMIAVGLAGFSRQDRWREWRWLAYPVLVIGAGQLVVEGFAHARALTLFVALAIYGVALLVASRLTRR